MLTRPSKFKKQRKRLEMIARYIAVLLTAFIVSANRLFHTHAVGHTVDSVYCTRLYADGLVIPGKPSLLSTLMVNFAGVYRGFTVDEEDKCCGSFSKV